MLINVTIRVHNPWETSVKVSRIGLSSAVWRVVNDVAVQFNNIAQAITIVAKMM